MQYTPGMGRGMGPSYSASSSGVGIKQEANPGGMPTYGQPTPQPLSRQQGYGVEGEGFGNQGQFQAPKLERPGGFAPHNEGFGGSTGPVKASGAFGQPALGRNAHQSVPDPQVSTT